MVPWSLSKRCMQRGSETTDLFNIGRTVLQHYPCGESCLLSCYGLLSLLQFVFYFGPFMLFFLLLLSLLSPFSCKVPSSKMSWKEPRQLPYLSLLRMRSCTCLYQQQMEEYQKSIVDVRLNMIAFVEKTMQAYNTMVVYRSEFQRWTQSSFFMVLVDEPVQGFFNKSFFYLQEEFANMVT